MEQLARHLEECDRCGELLDGFLNQDGLVAVLGIEPAPPQEEGDLAAVVRLQRCLRELWRMVPAPADRDTPVEGNNTPSPEDQAPHSMAEPVDFLAPPQAADEIGRLGSYGVLRVLGKGGMGIVFLAQQARPRRRVALKMILSGPCAGREQLARFQAETEVVARLSHPNIVQVHDAGEHDGRPYFTMEYVEGGSLADRLAQAPLPAVEAARLMQTLAQAVQHAHEQGLVHRDLKPSNVLLSADGTPRISDFGLAKQLPGNTDTSAAGLRTESGAILGTPAYMAPEQAADSGTVGPAADIYSLGAVLYEVAVGTGVAPSPPHRSVRAALPHTALALG
jgi:serine/threonine-protein kinase